MKYDFSKISKPEKTESANSSTDEDPRKNFKIAKCCANCKYFTYIPYNVLIGECKISNLKNMHAKGIGEIKTTKELREFGERNGWLPVHTTNVCDRHEARGQNSVQSVERQTNKKFNFDGTLRVDDVDI